MLIIDITQSDINAGCRWREDSCPVAVALQRATGHLWSVRWYRLRNQRRQVSIITPLEMSKWMQRFDRCGPTAVAPATFAVTVPWEEAA